MIIMSSSFLSLMLIMGIIIMTMMMNWIPHVRGRAHVEVYLGIGVSSSKRDCAYNARAKALAQRASVKAAHALRTTSSDRMCDACCHPFISQVIGFLDAIDIHQLYEYRVIIERTIII